MRGRLVAIRDCCSESWREAWLCAWRKQTISLDAFHHPHLHGADSPTPISKGVAAHGSLPVFLGRTLGTWPLHPRATSSHNCSMEPSDCLSDFLRRPSRRRGARRHTSSTSDCTSPYEVEDSVLHLGAAAPSRIAAFRWQRARRHRPITLITEEAHQSCTRHLCH